ncbi:MAG TPA: urea ABC transporter ATP-binding protein UrtD [Caproicibacter sp.]|nr:urea ABC transporter ATP-binding protein UrtD [Caproicibacter sp.]
MGEILRTERLSVCFSGFWALHDVDFSVNEGELRVVIGPNGAGKTTLMNLITGRTRPAYGKIVFNGHDITGRSPHEIASKYGIGRKFQGPNLFENMTVAENLALAVPNCNSVRKTFFRSAPKFTAEKADDVVRQIGLAEKRGRMACELSHGERQWLEIGMLMMQDPKLMILDEPTAGMTEEETRVTGEMIQKLLKGRTILVVEHDMKFVRQVAKTVTVLHMGQILAQGPIAAIENNPEVVRVYLKSERGAPEHACT